MSARFTKLCESRIGSVKITYSLAECEVDTGEGVFHRYGAAIETGQGERAAYPDIFGEREAAEAFVRELARGLVTPGQVRCTKCDGKSVFRNDAGGPLVNALCGFHSPFPPSFMATVVISSGVGSLCTDMNTILPP